MGRKIVRMNESLIDDAAKVLEALTAVGDAVVREGRGMDPGALHALAGWAAQIENAASALKGAALAHAVCVEDVLGEDGEITEHRHPVGHIDQYSAAEAAISVGATVGSAGYAVAQGAAWLCRFPRLAHEGAATGRISAWTIAKVLEVTKPLTDVECSLVEDDLLPILATLNPAKVTSTVRRLAQRVAKESLEAAAVKEARTRSLKINPGTDGLTQWTAWLPSDQSAVLWAAVTTRAKDLQAESLLEPDPTGTTVATVAGGHAAAARSVPSLDQARADALIDLALSDVTVSTTLTLGIPVLASATGGDPLTDLMSSGALSRPAPFAAESAPPMAVPAELQAELDQLAAEVAGWDLTGMTATVQAPLLWPETGAGDPSRHEPAPPDPTDDAGDGKWASPLDLIDNSGAWVSGVSIPGVGWIPAQAVATLMTSLPMELSRALLDNRSGVTCETSSQLYRTPMRLREHVIARDGTCRFPGCTRPARRFTEGDLQIDLDHATAWPAGATSPAQLGALCRRHHRTKQQKRWRHHLDPVTAVVTWTTPHGQVITTEPEHHLLAPTSVAWPQRELNARAAAAPAYRQLSGSPPDGSSSDADPPPF